MHGTLHHSVTTSPCSSRPPSRAISLCDGSSGYESTRSHLGPHYNIYNVPRSNSPVLKYNTLKPRRRKQKHSQQFYSLRLCRRHENIRRKYELYAIPIYKTCPHKSDSTTTIATIVRSMEDVPSLTLSQSASVSLTRSAPSTPIPPTPSPTPPVPAPRTPRKTDPSKHTYQNVPPPVFPPKDASLPKLKVCRLLMIYDRKIPHLITPADVVANELLGCLSIDSVDIGSYCRVILHWSQYTGISCSYRCDLFTAWQWEKNISATSWNFALSSVSWMSTLLEIYASTTRRIW